MSTVLEVSSITKKFGNLTAVNNLSFTVNKGDVFGILGPNGSGKSTTLGMLLQVVNPTGGSWSWFGEGNSHQQLKKIGAIIERPNFYPYMSAVQNLSLICQIKQTSKERIDEVLKLVGLYERKNSKFKTYSLGMKQRLAIASALLANPEVIILDEPTNGLDPEGIIEIRKIIRHIASNGTTVILASHLLDEVEKVCSHVLVMRQGKMLYSGRVDELTSGFGFVELKSDNHNTLMQALNGYKGIAEIKEDEGKVIALLNDDVSASELNTYLHSKSISVSHINKSKPNLEDQFLELVKQN
jgi:ABC-2 type transport system ATP-binding protein